VVRALLVPALVRLLGQWNWWLPSSLAGLLRVQPSPLASDGPDRKRITHGRHRAGDRRLRPRPLPNRATTGLPEVDQRHGSVDRPCMLSGHVRQGNGGPLAAAALTLIDLSGQQVGLTHTGADGSYRMIARAEGTYVLVAITGTNQPSASVISLHGQTTEHDLILSGSRIPAGMGRRATNNDGHGDTRGPVEPPAVVAHNADMRTSSGAD
jgi:hypothetical protein